MERIALIGVKLYQKANAYHHKTYAVYNGAHGPIRPPAFRRRAAATPLPRDATGGRMPPAAGLRASLTS
jgi:hypothetical protein